MNPAVVGFVAGILTSVAAIPQLVKTLRSHHVRDISIWQPLLLTMGVGLWMCYGILIGDKPLIVANIVPLICNIILIWMKIKYGKAE